MASAFCRAASAAGSAAALWGGFAALAISAGSASLRVSIHVAPAPRTMTSAAAPATIRVREPSADRGAAGGVLTAAGVAGRPVVAADARSDGARNGLGDAGAAIVGALEAVVALAALIGAMLPNAGEFVISRCWR